MSETVTYHTDGPLAIISLNRPEKLNAIDARMVDGLNAALDRAEADDAVRVILLRGEGRAFSAGFDLDIGDGDDAAVDEAFIRHELQRDFDLIMRFWNSPRPTVAAVHCWCLGSAMEMAVACDLTVAAEDCRFGAPEVKFGSGIVSLILPWVIGVKQAKELLLTGDDRVPAERALAMGLVNRVVPAADLEAAAHELALSIACNDRRAVALTKQAINRSCEIMGMRDALLQALDLDMLIETQPTDEARRFNEILKADGVKAALAWRAGCLKGATGA